MQVPRRRSGSREQCQACELALEDGASQVHAGTGRGRPPSLPSSAPTSAQTNVCFKQRPWREIRRAGVLASCPPRIPATQGSSRQGGGGEPPLLPGGGGGGGGPGRNAPESLTSRNMPRGCPHVAWTAQGLVSRKQGPHSAIDVSCSIPFVLGVPHCRHEGPAAPAGGRPCGPRGSGHGARPALVQPAPGAHPVAQGRHRSLERAWVSQEQPAFQALRRVCGGGREPRPQPVLLPGHCRKASGDCPAGAVAQRRPRLQQL